MDPLQFHDTASIYCWCGPKLSFAPNTSLQIVVAHRTYSTKKGR